MILGNYARTAAAVFTRRKFFTFVNLFGITFPLAILVVATTVLDHIFGGAPPEVHHDRTLGIYRACMVDEEGNGMYAYPGYGLLNRFARDLPGAEKVSVFSVVWKAVSYVEGRRIESYLKYTDAEFWEILRFQFIEGRPYTRDEVDNGRFVAVINEASKEKYFGTGGVVGQTLRLDGQRYTVIGVVKNVPVLRLVPFADIWVPQTTAKIYEKEHELVGFHVGMILARSKQDFGRIREEFRSRIASIDLSMYQPYERLVVVPETTFDALARAVFTLGKSPESYTARLIAALVALALVFLILPTVNLVNLGVSRIMERSSEIGVRKAFGAPTSALVGQFVVENLMLTLLGGALAVGVAFLVLGAVSRTGVLPYATFHLNGHILAYVASATLLFGVISGAYPAWRMSRMNPVDALRGVTQ